MSCLKQMKIIVWTALLSFGGAFILGVVLETLRIIK